jgi:hypothetical protein
MSDKPAIPNPSTTQSGILPRPILEPEDRHEAPPTHTPTTELTNSAVVDEVTPVITEGKDNTAQRDRDKAEGNEPRRDEQPQRSGA